MLMLRRHVQACLELERMGNNRDGFIGQSGLRPPRSSSHTSRSTSPASIGYSGCCSAAAAGGAGVYGAAATRGAACPAACRNSSTPRCGRRRPRLSPSCCGDCRSASSAPVTRCTMAQKVATSVLMYVVGARLDGRGRRRFPACPPAGPSRHRTDEDNDATPVGVQSVTTTAPCISIAAVAVATRLEVRRADGAELASTGDDWDVGLAASLGGAKEV
jgi:hypothetical protein